MDNDFGFYYDLAEYCNKAWRGKYSPREVATNAFLIWQGVDEKLCTGCDTVEIGEILDALKEDIDNGSDEAQAFYDGLRERCGMR